MEMHYVTVKQFMCLVYHFLDVLSNKNTGLVPCISTFVHNIVDIFFPLKVISCFKILRQKI